MKMVMLNSVVVWQVGMMKDREDSKKEIKEIMKMRLLMEMMKKRKKT